MSLQAMERFLISETLQRRKGNRKEAAKDLGINVSTLYRRINALQIELPEQDGRGRRGEGPVQSRRES
jgi:DNA-binding NtrC family response regulator